MPSTEQVPVHRSYNNGWFGAHGIYQGLRAVEIGAQRVVTFAVAPHPATSHDGDESALFVTIGRAEIDGVLCWRFCGGDDGRDPDGHSSHSLVASWEEQALAFAVAGLAIYLQRKCKAGWAIYRQPAKLNMAEAA